MSIEQFLENITLEEIEELKRLKELELNKIPTYSFSKIRDKELEDLVSIKQNINKEIFNIWFKSDIKLTNEEISFLKELLDEEVDYISLYDEEDLKMRFLSPILRKINFKTKDFRDFYDEKIVYKNEKFIFSGEVDFTISDGLRVAKKPYFFIQEFKRAEEFSNPRPQLIAELISAVELNSWDNIKGAFIVGAIWNFVILEKLGKDKYQYYISVNFDSTK
ncbi:MAG: hypothetical protein U9Q30_09180, partial [Campylobacterota bacterium]|nr:hypothetical protein [Campylobacterota bacterium]